MKEAFFKPSGGEAHVYSSSDRDNAFVIDGTISDLYAVGGRKITLLGTLTLTDLRVLGPANVTIRSGAAITNARLARGSGTVLAQEDVDNLYIEDGAWFHETAAADAIALVELHGGLFLPRMSQALTITTLSAYGGRFDARRHSGLLTISGGTVWRGATVNLDSGTDLISATLRRLGGRIIGKYTSTGTEVSELPGGAD